METRTRAMTALLCAIVATQKCQRGLLEFLKILPLSPELKSMALLNYLEATEEQLS